MKPTSYLVAFFVLSISCSPAAPTLTGDGQTLDQLDPQADNVASCTVKQNPDGSATIKCPDGTSATVAAGEPGLKGEAGDAGSNGTNGANGLNGTSITAATEAAGANCPNEGVSVWSNATSPASLIQYVCSGEDGAAGASGTSITAATAAAGGYCVAGGVSVWSNATIPPTLIQYVCSGEDGSSCGVINNGNGTYTMSCTNGTDVTWSNAGTGSTNPLIPDGVLYGSYMLTNSMDVAFLNGVTWVTGTLTISANGLTDIQLPELEGTGGLDIADNQTLQAVGFSFTTLHGNLRLKNLEGPPNFALPFERIEGRVDIYSNGLLTSFSMPVTYIGGTLYVEGNPLTSIDFPASYIGGNLSVNGSSISSINIPLQTLGGNIDISYTGISNLTFPALTMLVGDISIYENLSLCNDDALALATLFGKGTSGIYNNTGTCP